MHNNKNVKIWHTELNDCYTGLTSVLKYLKRDNNEIFLDNDVNDKLPITRLHPSKIKDQLSEEQLDKIKKIMYQFYGVQKGGKYKDESIVEIARYFPKEQETIDDIFSFIPVEIQPFFKDTFTEAKKLFLHCHDFYIFFQGNDELISKKTSAIKHVHPPYENNDYDFTFTTLIAIDIKEPIIETLHLQWTDYKVSNIQTYNKDYATALEEVMLAVDQASGDIINIPFPNKDRLTHVLFNSTNYVHWTTNLSSNKFLAVVFDGVKLL